MLIMKNLCGLVAGLSVLTGLVYPAMAQEVTAEQILQRLENANCRLHKNASVITMNKTNYKSLILCHGRWQGRPEFNKKINPNLIVLAIKIAGPKDVLKALSELGV